MPLYLMDVRVDPSKTQQCLCQSPPHPLTNFPAPPHPTQCPVPVDPSELVPTPFAALIGASQNLKALQPSTKPTVDNTSHRPQLSVRPQPDSLP